MRNEPNINPSFRHYQAITDAIKSMATATDPEKSYRQQISVLKKLLNSAKNSSFGKQYGFDEIIAGADVSYRLDIARSVNRLGLNPISFAWNPEVGIGNWKTPIG